MSGEQIALTGLGVSITGALIGWGMTVEARLSNVKTLVDKIDQLVDILLKRELDGPTPLQERRYPQESLDSRRPQPR